MPDPITFMSNVSLSKTPISSRPSTKFIIPQNINPCCLQVRCEWDLSPAQESALTSVVFLGTMMGSYLWGALSDAKGRRLGFASTAGCIFFFGVASALAPNFAVWQFLRDLMLYVHGLWLCSSAVWKCKGGNIWMGSKA